MSQQTLDDPARIEATVHGRVQGVNFRNYTVREARQLGVVGRVRNLPDGETVAVEAEGNRADLEALIARLRQGPPLARVERVDVSWTKPTGQLVGFRVTY